VRSPLVVSIADGALAPRHKGSIAAPTKEGDEGRGRSRLRKCAFGRKPPGITFLRRSVITLLHLPAPACQDTLGPGRIREGRDPSITKLRPHGGRTVHDKETADQRGPSVGTWTVNNGDRQILSRTAVDDANSEQAVLLSHH
jgi:hypothetical protein